MEFKDRIKVNSCCNNDYYKVYNKDGTYSHNIDIANEKNLKDEFLHGVTCFVINEKQEVLMEVRANTELTPGKIDLISGHVNGNENETQAIKRELEEEIGIKSDSIIELHKVSKYPKALGFESKGKVRNFFIDFYCVFTKASHFTIQPEEVESLKWFPMDEAFEMIKSGKTKFPKQDGAVNYEKIFNNVREKCRNINIQEKKVMDK